jgi:hypothetical protein
LLGKFAAVTSCNVRGNGSVGARSVDSPLFLSYERVVITATGACEGL